MDLDSIEIHIEPSFEKFYKNDFGIYTVLLREDSPNREKIKTEKYAPLLTLVGGMPKLATENTYVAYVTEKQHPQYGIQYEVSVIYKKLFSTKEDQIEFLSELVTAKQLESLQTAYPNENLVTLIKEDKLDVKLVNGIGEKTLAKIKDKIFKHEKYQVAIVELSKKYGVPFKAVISLSDKYGSPDLLLQKVEENPYILTEIDGYGFKKVDEIALKLGIGKDSPYRINACVEYILDEHADNGHCWVRRTLVVNDAIKLLGLKISDIEEVMSNGDKKYVLEDEIIYKKKYREYEEKIAFHIKRLLESKVDYFIPNIDKIIVEVEEQQGFKFTEEQREAIYKAVESNVIVVNGKAGTGKTSVIKGIANVLRKAQKLDSVIINDENDIESILNAKNVLSDTFKLEYATCALSGKASQRIHESTGLDSSTIHRTLGFNPQIGWGFNEDNQLHKDVIILDEASMVNSQLFLFLIRAIKSGAKFIITGDTAQLEPIGIGNVLVDLLASGVVPAVELTIVHRQAQKSGILSCANMVREGKKFISNNDYQNKRLGELKDLLLFPSSDRKKVYNKVLDISRKYVGRDILNFQVIVPMKNRGELSTKNLNKELQIIFNMNPEDVNAKEKIERKDVTFLVDDKVIINGNNYDKEIFNGTIGIIRHIDSEFKNGNVVVGEIVIDFEGVGNITFTKEEMNQMDLAYAISCHKSQGSQWENVVFAIDYSSFVLLNRQLTYTAMTRASKYLFMPVELKALQHSINTDKSSERNTFLRQFLKEAI